ncbi:SRPBCC domain-containing protein [uncultured Flavobacterium sp.]|uniref:SRPBCC domain-containing protein n=1 Tax=uncultured Flavobacterium sp. TaxID=165435 RepID=UPI0030817E22
METSNFSTTILVDNSKEEVFKAINNVRGWWQGEIDGNTENLNDEFGYSVPGIHFSKQKIVEIIPNEKIVWLITDSKLSFVKDQSEWTGTKIVFEISEVNHKTQIRFSHLGLVPEFECYGDCSNAWSQLIEKSLFSLITTGKGVNVFG